MSAGPANAANPSAAAQALEQAATPAPAAAPALSPLLDLVLSQSSGREVQRGYAKLEDFLEEPLPVRGLRAWLGDWLNVPDRRKRDAIARKLNRDIAHIDQLLNDQVNAILHHPAFQKLEASCGGLRYLVDQIEEPESIKIRVLNVSWKEVTTDLGRAIEFDQSQLFRKVYTEEFGTPGGEPFSMILGDYLMHHKPGEDHPEDDIEAMRNLSQVAAASFAPFIAGVDPTFFNLDSFADLDRPINLSSTFEQLEYVKWRSFRDSEDARFVGLVIPRVLMRTPYEDDGQRQDDFRFCEDVEAPGRRNYLWGNGAYAFASVLVRAFAEGGWLADIRGVQQGVEAGGVVSNLPVHSFGTERMGIAQKSSLEMMITQSQEKEFADLGFMAMCQCEDTEYCAFYSNQSVQKPKKYDEVAATVNARISSMMQYMLCVSRFAHYMKVIMRDKVAKFAEATDVERFLHNWVHKYVTADDSAAPEVKARFPLREAKIQVRERPDKPGSYFCVAHFRPHYQLDEMTGSVKLITELAPSRR